MRDDFAEDVRRNLAARVGNLCSNPDCRTLTSGPQNDPVKAVNLGVAAHITGAAAGGPRYDGSLSAVQRRHSDNGIWLCQNCAKLIDKDISRFTEKLLRAWKTLSEDRARNSLGKTAFDQTAGGGPTPELKLYLKSEDITNLYAPCELQRRFVLGLTNAGDGTARFPSIRFLRSCGLAIDSSGIDGNRRFGLPESPSRNECIAFKGGVDHVIHAKYTLEIAMLTQRGEKRGIEGLSQDELKSGMASTGQPPVRWLFKRVRLVCEISCEGTARLVEEKEMPEVWQTQFAWPRVSR
jgi:hypothetical protein